jgi:hypothetical protein
MWQYHWISKSKMLWFNVLEDKVSRLKGKPSVSKNWHPRLSREYKSRLETGTENLGEIYYRVLQLI